MSDIPTPSSAPDMATILQTVQQLTDIEGDFADTAAAVALAPPPAEAVAEPGAIEAEPNPVLQSAEAMEAVLEQSIPDAPPSAAADAVAQAPDTEAVMETASDSTAALPTLPERVPAASTDEHTSLNDPAAAASTEEDTSFNDPDAAVPSADNQQSAAAVPEPIVIAEASAIANSDEIDIDDDSYSSIQVDGPSDPAVTEAPALEDAAVSDAVEEAPVNAQDASTSDTIVNGHDTAPIPASLIPPSVQPTETGTAPDASTSSAPTGPLPEGILASYPSVVSNPQIIQDWRRDPTNPQIVLALFSWSIQRSEVIDARGWYAVLAKENPTASQPLLDLINLESSLTNFAAVEALFARALKGPSGGITASADVNIWKAYLHYIRRQNPVGTGAADEEAKRRVITDAYEFALKQCGVDREAGEVWAEYIAFVQDTKAKNTWETQAQQDTLRKIYQRAICIPLNNVEVLWKGYDAFEASVNKQTSKKFLAERSPAYMTARTALRELRTLTDSLPHPTLPPSPTFSDTDRQLVAGWKAYLKWEEGNPLVIDDKEVLAGRVGYAMRKCLAEMRHFPEIWHYVAQHFQRDGTVEEAAEVLRAGVEACPKSILLTFAAAEVEEDRRNFTEAHTLFSDLLEHLGQDSDRLTEVIAEEVIVAKGPEIPKPQGEGMDVDGEGPQATYNRLNDEREERGKMVSERRGREVEELATAMGVVWVMYMRYARRAEGIKAARAIFGKARKSAHVTWHIFEASALMEYHVNKDSAVAIRIFELGFKLFAEDVDYVVRYLQFLLNVNDDTNARALFERSALKIPAEKSRSLWDTWAKYEYMYGDLGAVQKLEQRFSETFPSDSPLKRFAQRYTYNGIDQIARRDLGFGITPRTQPAPHSQFIPPPPNLQQPQIPPNALPAHTLPPPPLAAASPNGKRPHPQSPQRPRRSIERSHSPSRGGGGPQGADFGAGHKRYRPNSPPPPPRRYDQGPPPPVQQALPPNGRSGRGYGPAPGGRSPLPDQRSMAVPPYPPSSAYPPPGQGRNISGNAGPPMGVPPPAQMGNYVPPPREGWDRSGVSKAVAWFVGQLPTARSFDGPVFRADDIMGLFSTIGPDGLRPPTGGPGPVGGGYPLSTGGPVYASEPPRGYGGGGPPRRY